MPACIGGTRLLENMVAFFEKSGAVLLSDFQGGSETLGHRTASILLAYWNITTAAATATNKNNGKMHSLLKE